MPHHHPPQGPNRKARPGTVTAARGGLKLVVGGTRHVTGLVEALHGQIQRLAPPLRRVDAAGPPVRPDDTDGLPPTFGLTGLVYRSIQGSMRLVGDGLDGLLAPFDSALASGEPSPRRDALVAALNGVLGDHLVRSGNPLAIPLQLRQNGQPLDAAALGPQRAAPRAAADPWPVHERHRLAPQRPRPWRTAGPGLVRRRSMCLQQRPPHLGQRPGAGRRAGTAAGRLAGSARRDHIVGHSMGGLVARSALAQAAGQQMAAEGAQAGLPGHAAPWRAAGARRQLAAPGDGHESLRGAVHAAVEAAQRRHHRPAPRQPAGRRLAGRKPLQPCRPAHAGAAAGALQAFAIASTAGAPGIAGSLLGDGLVPVDSALGHHKRRALDLGLPATHQWVGTASTTSTCCATRRSTASCSSWLS